MRAAIEARAKDVGSRYKGRFAEYDLNNEMMHANYYEQRLGPEFIKQMALWVKQEDPGAKLCVNDYDVLTGNRLADYVKEIRGLLDMGVPIAGIGAQGHLHGDSFDAAALQNGLDELAKFKLPIRITEYNFPGQRSKFYTGDHAAMWGFWEAANWIPQSSLYKRDWTPLPAAAAYEDLVLNKWWTRWSGAADRQGRAELRAFYGTHKVTVNGKETVVTLTKAEGSKTVSLQ